MKLWMENFWKIFICFLSGLRWGTWALHVVGGLLYSCGVQAPELMGSVVVACEISVPQSGIKVVSQAL